MSRPRHSNGKLDSGSRIVIGLAVGIPSVLIGIVLLFIALVEAFRYSPYGDPGAGNVALWLGILGLVTFGGPILVVMFATSRAGLRTYRAWKKTLTPAERFAVDAAEVAALWGAHLAFRKHHKQVSARLTASVMGNGPKLGDPGMSGWRGPGAG